MCLGVNINLCDEDVMNKLAADVFVTLMLINTPLLGDPQHRHRKI